MTLRVAVGASSFGARDETPIRMLEQAGIEVKLNPHKRRMNEEETVEHLAEVDGLIAGLEPLNEKVLASAVPRLKVVARVGIGMNNVDREAAERLGVKVSNTPEPPTQAVAELTVTAALALLRGLVGSNQAMHAGQWKKVIGKGLIDTPVLLVGYGRIGRKTGEYLRAFGARLLVCDPALSPGDLEHGERLVTLEEGLAEAEMISLHAAGAETILGPAQFELMREGVYLLNSARGELVDEAALVAALESGRVAGVWFDAFWQEPYEGRLTEFDQALLTPHVCTYSAQCRLNMETEAARNVMRDLGVGPA